MKYREYRRWAWNIAFLLPLALLTANCVASRKPLFDSAKAVTPFAPGTYVEQRKKEGKWVEHSPFTLRREGNSYSMDTWKEKVTSLQFELHEIGKETYLAASREKTISGARHTMYTLLQKDGDAYVFNEMRCVDFKFARLPRNLQPFLDAENCVYDNRETLIQAVLAYAKMSGPDARYVRLGPSDVALPPVATAALMKRIQECAGPVQLKQGFITRRDINEDGKPDFILDYSEFECNGTAIHWCGTAGCVTEIFASKSDGEYVEVLNRHVRQMKFARVSGRPAILLNVHGSNCGRAGQEACSITLFWNGFEFSPAN